MAEPIQTPPGTEVPPVTPTPPAPPSDPTPPINYEEKFSESTRENQIISARNKELEGRIRELTNQPTDSELRAAFPDWEFMDENAKRSSRMAFEAKRATEKLQLEREQERAEQTWNRDLEAAITAHPELDGKEREFKEFASQTTHKGAPMQVLVDAFLHKIGSVPPNPNPLTPRQGLEPGSGGPRGPEKPKVLSGEELKLLRKTDEKAYVEYIKTHDTTADL
jgi:hypothetical protein